MSLDKLPVIAVLTFCGFASAQSAENRTLPAGTMQRKARAACTSCHDEKIIVQQRLTKALWIREVDKMIKWGAILDASDRDGLIEYFSENFPSDKPPYVAPRSAASTRRSSASAGNKPRD